MREIKFRAWNGERIVKVLTIGWTDGEVDWIDTSKISGPVEDFIIMQYTGLKDKNGVDIYEGDILYVEQQSRGTIDQFIPNKRSVAVRYEAKDTAYVFDEEHGQAIGLYTITDELEIIGNVYENPELLEEE